MPTMTSERWRDARVRALLLALVFSQVACTMAFYAPWHRPPEVRQAAPEPVIHSPQAEQLNIVALSLLARVMVDRGEPVDKILAALQAEGLEPKEANKILYVALAPAPAKGR